MDVSSVDDALTLDGAWHRELREVWLELMDLCVWGALKSSRIGALTKVRKRLLEVGERLRSLFAERDWIPHPRERIKNALASAYNLKDALLQFERAAQEIDGGAELDCLNELTVRLHVLIVQKLEPYESRWATLINMQYEDYRPIEQ